MATHVFVQKVANAKLFLLRGYCYFCRVQLNCPIVYHMHQEYDVTHQRADYAMHHLSFMYKSCHDAYLSDTLLLFVCCRDPVVVVFGTTSPSKTTV